MQPTAGPVERQSRVTDLLGKLCVCVRVHVCVYVCVRAHMCGVCTCVCVCVCRCAIHMVVCFVCV